MVGKVVMVSSDNVKFEVTRKAAAGSGLLTECLQEGDDSDLEVPLPKCVQILGITRRGSCECDRWLTLLFCPCLCAPYPPLVLAQRQG
jgi:hypothetical protein